LTQFHPKQTDYVAGGINVAEDDPVARRNAAANRAEQPPAGQHTPRRSTRIAQNNNNNNGNNNGNNNRNNNRNDNNVVARFAELNHKGQHRMLPYKLQLAALCIAMGVGSTSILTQFHSVIVQHPTAVQAVVDIFTATSTETTQTQTTEVSIGIKELNQSKIKIKELNQSLAQATRTTEEQEVKIISLEKQLQQQDQLCACAQRTNSTTNNDSMFVVLLKNAFNESDQDFSNELSESEIGCFHTGLLIEPHQNIVDVCDKDQNGGLSIDELLECHLANGILIDYLLFKFNQSTNMIRECIQHKQKGKVVKKEDAPQ